MEPRLKNSTQWTPYPTELCEQAMEVLTERFSEEYGLEKSQFVVEGRIYKEELIGRFGLNTPEQLKQPNFEISVEYDQEKDKVLEVIQASMDMVEHLWTELLEEDFEDYELSKEWQPLNLDKKTYHYRYSTVNTQLEEQADQWLEENEKKLVYGERSDEEEPLEESSEKDESALH